jgi:hypothetical protein
MQIRTSQRRIRARRLALAVGACGVAAGAAVLALHAPSESSFYPRCPFHEATGLHCPGCGLTRAMHSLLNGQIQQAFAYNGVGLVFFPILAFSILGSLWAWASDERLGDTTTESRPWLTWILGAFLVLYGIARNLPMEPFTALAPHELQEPPITANSEGEAAN